jgi:hypothetical protein
MDAYQFASVRDALAQTFAIVADKMPAFTARLEHLRRSGAMPEGRGKGFKATYTLDQIDRLAFALALMRSNIELVTALELIRANWESPDPGRDPVKALAQGKASIGELFAASREKERVFVIVRIADFVAKNRLPVIGGFLDGPKSREGFFGWLNDAENFAGVFNLTALTKKLDAALNEASKPKSPLAGIAAQIVRAGRRRRGEIK